MASWLQYKSCIIWKLYTADTSQLNCTTTVAIKKVFHQNWLSLRTLKYSPNSIQLRFYSDPTNTDRGPLSTESLLPHKSNQILKPLSHTDMIKQTKPLTCIFTETLIGMHIPYALHQYMGAHVSRDTISMILSTYRK